mgnify:CR=1 FL=1
MTEYEMFQAVMDTIGRLRKSPLSILESLERDISRQLQKAVAPRPWGFPVSLELKDLSHDLETVRNSISYMKSANMDFEGLAYEYESQT